MWSYLLDIELLFQLFRGSLFIEPRDCKTLTPITAPSPYHGKILEIEEAI